MVAESSPLRPRVNGLGRVAVAALLLWGCPVEKTPAPASIQISPADGLAGTKFPVTIRGTNTDFSPLTFGARFIDPRGAEVSGIRVSSETAARLEVTLAADAAAGPRRLRIDAPPHSFVMDLQVRVAGEEPSLMLEPRLGGPGSELDLLLDGSATHFEDGVTTVLFPENSGVTVHSVSATSATLATAHIEISPDATGGTAIVAVVTRDELVVSEFQIVTEAQAAVSVDPPEGYSGNTVDVVVSGARADFGGEGDVVTLSFDAGAGVEVSDVAVASPTRLSARFAIDPLARAGFRRFTVRVDPAEPDAEVREYDGTFSVRAPGTPGVRLLPPLVHRGGTATLWLEGRGTDFDPSLEVRPPDASGIELTGRWVLGPTGAAVRVRVADDASLGTARFTIEDGVHEGLTAAVEVLGADASVVDADPPVVEGGAEGVEVRLTSPVDAFNGALTSARTAVRSGLAIRALEVVDPRTLIATLDVRETAPTGRSVITMTTGAQVATATLTVVPAEGRGSITLDPPVARAGIGRVEVAATARDAVFASAIAAELSDPATTVAQLVAEPGTAEATITIDVPRSATPGDTVLVMAQGSERLATSLEVLDGTSPTVRAARSTLVAGRAGQVVVVYGERTSWIEDVTVAAAPVARGLSVDGLTVIDRTTAVLEVTVSSEAPLGATGIVLATHGEVAVAPLEIVASDGPPSITLDPPSVEPGQSTSITIRGTNVDFARGPLRVDFPESPAVRVIQALVIDPATLEVQIEVDGAAEPGTRPCEVEAPGLSVRAGLAVRPAGAPAVWIDPSRIRRGPTVRLEARVDGLDLPTGPVSVEASEVDVLVGEVVVGEVPDRASVDVTIPSSSSVDAFWLTITAGPAAARHRVLVDPAMPVASADGSSVEAGTGGTEVVIAGEDTTFAPEETMILPGAAAAALRLGTPLVASTTQVRVPVDVSAAADVDLADVVLLTGSELAVVSVGVRGASRVAFDSPGRVQGSVLSDRGALLAYVGEPGTLQLLSAVSDVAGAALGLSSFAPDGFSPLVPSKSDPAALVFALPSGAILHVHATTPPPEGGDPLDFDFDASPLVPDAATELEPNDDDGSAELFPDPVACNDPEDCPGIAPTFMVCSFDPAGDRDVFVVPASTPVAFEVYARRLVPGSAGADVGMRAPWPGPLVAPGLGADLVAILDPGALGEESTVALEGLAGANGSYLVVVRSAVVVDELGWTDPASYIELRAAPGVVLDDFTMEIVDAVGSDPILPPIDLRQVVADDTGLVLVSSLEVADVVVPDLALPEDGAVVVRWRGNVVDAVAFGASVHWEGTPVDIGDALAVGRRFGIDRNDNAADFTARAPSPGGE